MLVLVTYDVSTTSRAGRRRLTRIAGVCCGFGQRVQNSVFACRVDDKAWARLRSQLLELADLTEDSLRFYHLGEKPGVKNEHFGIKKIRDLDAPLIF